MKGIGIDRVLYLLSGHHVWSWPWIFKVKFLKNLCDRNGRADWHWKVGIWIDRMLDPCCDFDLWPHWWPWSWIFKVKIEIAVSQEWEGRLTWNERLVSWIWCWVHNGIDLGPQCMANRSAKLWVNVKLLQFPTCWPMNGLLVHWSRSWGVLSCSFMSCSHSWGHF